MENSIYEPREDSYQILESVKKYAKGVVLDIGTGSGILAIEASKTADFVYGADINETALEYAEKQARGIKNIKFIKSDVFNYFKKHNQTFDLIVFNPPYLPEDKREPKDSKLQTTGGKKGYEILERFLSEAGNFLKPKGKVIILFSSLTGKKEVEKSIKQNNFNFEKLAEEKCSFEKLYVYLLEKTIK